MVGSYRGVLVGYRTYDKDGKTKHVYDVFCSGRHKDPQTGLYTEPCEMVVIIEDNQVLKELKYGLPVTFSGEPINGKNGMFVRYSGIEALEN